MNHRRTICTVYSTTPSPPPPTTTSRRKRKINIITIKITIVVVKQNNNLKKTKKKKKFRYLIILDRDVETRHFFFSLLSCAKRQPMSTKNDTNENQSSNTINQSKSLKN